MKRIRATVTSTNIEILAISLSAIWGLHSSGCTMENSGSSDGVPHDQSDTSLSTTLESEILPTDGLMTETDDPTEAKKISGKITEGEAETPDDGTVEGCDTIRPACGVNAFEADLGFTQAFVNEHKRYVGALSQSVIEGDAGTESNNRDFVAECSGTLIGPDLFMTNHHCIQFGTPEPEWRGKFITFNYEEGGDAPVMHFPIESLVETGNPDAAILRLTGDPGTLFGWARFRESDPVMGEPLAIIQHPGGLPKQVGVGLVVIRNTIALGHNVDTAPGSSGSGILDRDGLFAGLHRFQCCLTSTPQIKSPFTSWIMTKRPAVRDAANGIYWREEIDWCLSGEDQLVMGDFDNDGRDDLLCDRKNGDVIVSLAEGSGRFENSRQIDGLSWCSEEDTLYAGDLNGDGRDDLLCHRVDGTLERVFAEETGAIFGKAGIVLTASLCRDLGDVLYVGEFDGGAGVDLLCHHSSGELTLTRSDGVGGFLSPKVASIEPWCNRMESHNLVALLDNDNRADLLCVDSDGSLEVATAGNDYLFAPMDIHETLPWRPQVAEALLAGDVNGDTLDDLIYRDAEGTVHVALLDIGGRTLQVKDPNTMAWCAAGASTLLAGQLNSDGRTDLLCLENGVLSVSNARPDGGFKNSAPGGRSADDL